MFQRADYASGKKISLLLADSELIDLHREQFLVLLPVRMSR